MKRKKKGLPHNPVTADVSKRKRMWGWLLVVLLMSVWMFIVGLLVGRGTAPVRFDIEKLQKELSDLRRDAAARKKADETSAHGVKKKTDLEFYEALKEKGITVKKARPVPAKKAPLKAPAVKKTNPDTVKTEKPTDKKAPVKAPKAEEASGQLTIQVAALKDVKVAGQLVERLKRKGYEAYRTMVKIPGKGTWYRIRIGSYRTRAEAADTLAKLKQEGLDGFLVNK